jgi:hypothetical protein
MFEISTDENKCRKNENLSLSRARTNIIENMNDMIHNNIFQIWNVVLVRKCP